MYYNKSRLIEILNNNDLDAIIASTKENLLYFTGFESVIKTSNPYKGHCYSIILKDDPDTVHVVMPSGIVDQIFDSNVKIGKIKTFGTFYREYENSIPLDSDEEFLMAISDNAYGCSDPIQALTSLLIDLGLSKSRIGFDEDGMIHNIKHIVKDVLPQIIFTEASSIIRQVRLIKTSDEINLLTIAARHNENAIQSVINNLSVGMSELDIKLIYESSLIKQGSRPALTMLKIGRNAVFGHNRQQESISLKAGDLIWFDSDSTYNGYWSDIARVFLYKSLDNSILHKAEALLKGQQTAINEIKAGMTGGEIFKLTMNSVHVNGFKSYRRHHVGHGIGLEPYETPLLSPNSNDCIENGMVISVETPYYEFGLGALHMEDPILINSTGNLKLTQTNSGLEIID